LTLDSRTASGRLTAGLYKGLLQHAQNQVRTANGDFEMSNESYGGLFLNSPAGALVQAVDLAANSDRAGRKRMRPSAALGSGQTRPGGAGFSRAVAVATAGLVIGCIVGATLIVTLTV
jgi:hypothetical protein